MRQLYLYIHTASNLKDQMIIHNIFTMISQTLFTFDEAWTTEEMSKVLEGVKNPLSLTQVMTANAKGKSIPLYITPDNKLYVTFSGLCNAAGIATSFSYYKKSLREHEHYVTRGELIINQEQYVNGPEVTKMRRGTTIMLTLRGLFSCILRMRGSYKHKGEHDSQGSEKWLEGLKRWVELCMYKLEEVSVEHSSEIERNYALLKYENDALREQMQEQTLNHDKFADIAIDVADETIDKMFDMERDLIAANEEIIIWRDSFENLRELAITYGIPIDLIDEVTPGGGDVMSYRPYYDDTQDCLENVANGLSL